MNRHIAKYQYIINVINLVNIIKLPLQTISIPLIWKTFLFLRSRTWRGGKAQAITTDHHYRIGLFYIVEQHSIVLNYFILLRTCNFKRTNGRFT